MAAYSEKGVVLPSISWQYNQVPALEYLSSKIVIIHFFFIPVRLLNDQTSEHYYCQMNQTLLETKGELTKVFSVGFDWEIRFLCFFLLKHEVVCVCFIEVFFVRGDKHWNQAWGNWGIFKSDFQINPIDKHDAEAVWWMSSLWQCNCTKDLSIFMELHFISVWSETQCWEVVWIHPASYFFSLLFLFEA